MHHRTEKRRSRAESQAVSDRFVVKVQGSVSLDPSDPRDVELWNGLEGGGDVTLQIEGRVNRQSKSPILDCEGEPTGVKFEAAVGVQTVYRPHDA
jgi:hypothetical protein